MIWNLLNKVQLTMPTFSYKALDRDGTIKESSLAAKDKEEAGLALQQRELTPISIKLKEKRKKFAIGSRVKLLEKASFARYMGLMLRSGLSMSKGVDALAEETDNPELHRILNNLSYGLKSGRSVSSVLGGYPLVFDDVFISMVKAGEVSGTLADTFSYLADKLRAEYELNRQIKGAMAYPVIISLTMLFMGAVMVVFVLPRIGQVFATMKIQLPLPTRVLLFIGNFIQTNLFYIIPLVVIVAVFLWLFIPVSQLKRLVVRFLAWNPITRNIVVKIDYARFTRTLSALLHSGVSITKGIEVSLSTVSQPRIRNLSAEIRQQLIKGTNLSAILKQHHVFPAFINQMLTIGEQSGNLAEILGEVGEYYQQEVEADLKNITQIIEPVLILIVGILVGLMVISVISPIYKLIGSLQIQQ